MIWFLKHHIHLSSLNLKLYCLGLLPWPLLEASGTRVPVKLLPIILQPFMLYNPPHKLMHVLGGSHLRDSFNSDS